MNKKRPVNLDLGTLKFPPMAVASILHRISGVVLFLLMPAMLYFLHLSLRSAESFAHAQILLNGMFCKLIVWAFGTAMIFHLLAGIRHLLMDMGFGEQLDAGRRSAVLVMVMTIILTILLGIWLW